MENHLITIVLKDGTIYHENKECKYHQDALANINVQLKNDKIESGYRFCMYIDDDLKAMANNDIMIIRNAIEFYIIDRPLNISVEQLKFLKHNLNILNKQLVIEKVIENTNVDYIKHKTFKINF